MYDLRTAGETGLHAMRRIYSRIGFGGLWNGLPVRIAMVRNLHRRLVVYHHPIPSHPAALMLTRDLLNPDRYSDCLPMAALR